MKKELEIVKALIKEMNEELKGGQKKLDVAAPFGKLTGADFKKLRGMKEDATDDKIDRSELEMLKKMYKRTPTDKIKAMIDKLEAKLGVNENHEGQDHEVSMANNSLDSILWAAEELKKHLGGQERDIPAWIQDHITNAENYILQAAKNFHEYGQEEAPEEEPADDNMSLSSLMEAKKKPSAGLTKKQKSAVAKKAKAGKDIGAKGKGFEKIAKKAAKKYGSEERGKKVAAAAMWKNVKRK